MLSEELESYALRSLAERCHNPQRACLRARRRSPDLKFADEARAGIDLPLAPSLSYRHACADHLQRDRTNHGDGSRARIADPATASAIIKLSGINRAMRGALPPKEIGRASCRERV